MEPQRSLRNVEPPRVGPRAAGPPTITEQRAVVVGISSYPESQGHLANATRDAEDVSRLLIQDFGYHLDPAGRPLLDHCATRKEIEAAVRDSLARSTTGTRWLFYFAGHGHLGGNRAYLLSADYDGCETRGRLDLRWLLDRCVVSRCAEVLIVLDACYAGQALVRPEELTDELDPEAIGSHGVRQVLAAGGPQQEVLDGGGEGHSVFTRCLIEALEGWSAIHEADGSISLMTLRDHLQIEVVRRLKVILGHSLAEESIGEEVQGEADLQRVLGGSLARSPWQRDFRFEPRVDRPLAETVRWVRSLEPSVCRRGLARLAEELRSRPGMFPLTARLAQAALDHSQELTDIPAAAEVRAAALTTLGALLESGNRERRWEGLIHTVSSTLLLHARDDPSPRAREAARRALGRSPEGRQRELAQRLLALHGDAPRPSRRRLLEILISLPQARRELPTTLRLSSPWIRSGLRIAAGWRWTTATPLRRRLTALPPAAFLLLYLHLGVSYYLSTPRNSNAVVLRNGHPGFTILPGIGRIAVETDFDLRDFRDPSPLREEKLFGTWLDLRGGTLGWAHRLTRRLPLAKAALTLWRLGDFERAWSHLAAGVTDGDSASIELAGYLAVRPEIEVRPALELLVDALAENRGAHAEVLATLARIRDLQPMTAPLVLEAFSKHLEHSEGPATVALLQGFATVNVQQGNLASGIPARLLTLGTHSPDPETRLAAIRALETLLPDNPELLSEALPELCAAAQESTVEERRALLSLLGTVVSGLEARARGLLQETVLATLVDPEADIRRAGLGLATQLITADSTLGKQLLQSLSGLTRDPDPQLQIQATLALARLPAPLAGQTQIVSRLSELSAGNAPAEIRSEALRVMVPLYSSLLQPEILTALSAAALDPSPTLRSEALRDLTEIALTEEPTQDRVVAILTAALEDRDPWVRRSAGEGILLLAERSEGSLGVPVDLLIQDLTDAEEPSWAQNAARLPRDFARASQASTFAVARELASHLPAVDVFAADRLSRFLTDLGTYQPEVLPKLVALLTGLAASSDPDGDLAGLVRRLLWTWRNLPLGQLKPAVDLLIQQLHDAQMPTDRMAAALGLGILTAQHEELAARSVEALVPHLRDPALEVRVRAAEALGLLGPWRQGTAGRAATALVDCLSSGPSLLQFACADALARFTASHSAPPAVLEALAAALRHPEGRIRRSTATALRHAARHARLQVRALAGALHQALEQEVEPETRLVLAAAFAAASDSPEVARTVMELAEAELGAEDASRASSALWMLRDVGEANPTLAPRVLGLLAGQLSTSNLENPRWVLLAIRDVGMAHPSAARQALDLLETVLQRRDEALHWDALNNGVSPIVRFQPATAPRALILLRRYLHGAPPRHAGSRAIEALVETLTVLTPEDLEPALALLASGSRFERQAAEEALLRVAAADPDLTPRILRRLAAKRRSPRPQLRIAAARSEEGIQLLVRTRELASDPERESVWREALEHWPEVGLGTAVEMAIAELENRTVP